MLGPCHRYGAGGWRRGRQHIRWRRGCDHCGAFGERAEEQPHRFAGRGQERHWPSGPRFRDLGPARACRRHRSGLVRHRWRAICRSQLDQAGAACRHGPSRRAAAPKRAKASAVWLASMPAAACQQRVLAYEGEPVSLCLTPRDGRTPAGVILQREDGSVEALRLSPCDLQFRDAVALDGRRQKTVEAKLPPQPLGRTGSCSRTPRTSCAISPLRRGAAFCLRR